MRKKKSVKHKKRGLKPLLLLIPFGVGLVCFLIARISPNVCEGFFSKGIFVVLSHCVGFITGLVPFSVSEILLVGAIVALIVCIILMIIKKLRVSSFFISVAGVLSFSFMLYMLLHGVNFYRNTAYELMGYDEKTEFTSTELYEACKKTAQKANAERKNIAEDESGNMMLSQDLGQTLALAKDGYRNLSVQYSFLYAPSANVKGVMLSHLWSYTGISGIYVPMLCEPNVNIDVPDSRIPVDAAHELAHACGFAREDECNFFAYITSISSQSADFRYSGYLFAFSYLSNALYSENKELYNKAVALLDDGVINDMKQLYDYWQGFYGGVMEVSDTVNDAFIKSQGVDEGVKSYEGVVGLLLHYELKK